MSLGAGFLNRMRQLMRRTNFLVDADAGGLDATPESIAYVGGEIDRHQHSWERWAGVAAAPDAELHVADFDSMTPFVPDAGNDQFGVWLQLIGSDDTPVDAGMVEFDPHRVFISTVQRANTIYRIQIAAGASGAAAFAAGDYTEIPFSFPAVSRQGPFNVRGRRCPVGTKIWVRVWADGEASGTVNLFLGIHEYEG